MNTICPHCVKPLPGSGLGVTVLFHRDGTFAVHSRCYDGVHYTSRDEVEAEEKLAAEYGKASRVQGGEPMDEITEEMSQKYLGGLAARCPFCGSDQIEAGKHEFESIFAWQRVSCHACGEEWDEVFTMTHIEKPS